MHISELSHKHVAKAEDVVQSGQEVETKIISVDAEARRIGLSIKELEPKPATPPAPAPSRNRQPQPDLSEGTDNEELTTNLGAMFGDLFKDTKDE